MFSDIPEETRQTIDKTVAYILKNGPSFEERLKKNSGDKFGFLNPQGEYHDYYKWKISQTPKPEAVQSTQAQTEVESQNVPPPPPLVFKTTFPRPVSCLDLDTIKLTALYVASNGPEYLEPLVKHQSDKGNKVQFEFTNSSHSLHPLYQQYVTQYTKTIQFLEHKEQLDHHFDQSLLDRAINRAAHQAVNQDNKKRDRKIKSEQQKMYASIDWQDFAIVGRIVFDEIDEVQELAVPLSRHDLLARSLEMKTKDIQMTNTTKTAPKTNTESGNEIKNNTELDNTTRAPKGMKIRAAGESRLKPKTTSTTIKCPISGQMVEESEFDAHLRKLLKNPRYQHEQDNYLKKNFAYESNLTTDQVYENIKRLVRKRPAPESTETQSRKK